MEIQIDFIIIIIVIFITFVQCVQSGTEIHICLNKCNRCTVY